MKVGAALYALMVRKLLDGDITCLELARVTGLSIITVRQYVTALHKKKAVYISGWGVDVYGRHAIRYFSIGAGPDVRKPKPQTRTQITQRYRQRLVQRTLDKIKFGDTQRV